MNDVLFARPSPTKLILADVKTDWGRTVPDGNSFRPIPSECAGGWRVFSLRPLDLKEVMVSESAESRPSARYERSINERIVSIR